MYRVLHYILCPSHISSDLDGNLLRWIHYNLNGGRDKRPNDRLGIFLHLKMAQAAFLVTKHTPISQAIKLQRPYIHFHIIAVSGGLSVDSKDNYVYF